MSIVRRSVQKSVMAVDAVREVRSSVPSATIEIDHNPVPRAMKPSGPGSARRLWKTGMKGISFVHSGS